MDLLTTLGMMMMTPMKNWTSEMSKKDEIQLGLAEVITLVGALIDLLRAINDNEKVPADVQSKSRVAWYFLVKAVSKEDAGLIWDTYQAASEWFNLEEEINSMFGEDDPVLARVLH